MPAQTFRVSFSRAFRSPSFINSHIDTTVLNEVNLGALSPLLTRFVFPIHAVGNPDLTQETLTAYEIGYTGVIGNRATVSAAVYWNTTENGIYFTPTSFYTPAAPPPTWPPGASSGAGGARGVESSCSAPVPVHLLEHGQNQGQRAGAWPRRRSEPLRQRVHELFLPGQAEAEELPPGTTINDINWPAKNRFNAGFDFSYSRFLGNMAVSYTGEAYWQDVLDARYAGTTEAYTLMNAGFGVRWAGDRIVTSIKITNLANQEVMQHIFGDVIKRQVVGEARLTF